MRVRNRKDNKSPEEQEAFSKRTMCKRMILPGIIGGVIGAFISVKYIFIIAAVFALLSGIWYCEQFDDEQ